MEKIIYLLLVLFVFVGCSLEEEIESTIKSDLVTKKIDSNYLPCGYFYEYIVITFQAGLSNSEIEKIKSKFYQLQYWTLVETSYNDEGELQERWSYSFPLFCCPVCVQGEQGPFLGPQTSPNAKDKLIAELDRDEDLGYSWFDD